MPLALLAALLATAPVSASDPRGAAPGPVPSPFACVALAPEAELRITATSANARAQERLQVELEVRGGQATLVGSRVAFPRPAAEGRGHDRIEAGERRQLVEAAGRAALARDPQAPAIEGLDERDIEVVIAWRCARAGEESSLRREGGYLTGLPVPDPVTLALGELGATGPGGWRHRPDHSSARNLADLVEATVLAHRLDQ